MSGKGLDDKEMGSNKGRTRRRRRQNVRAIPRATCRKGINVRDGLGRKEDIVEVERRKGRRNDSKVT